MRRRSPLLTLIATLLAMASTYAADSIDVLKARQAHIERELEEVKRQIAALDESPDSLAPREQKPLWYVTSFGIDEVNSAGGVEPFFVLYNPNQSSPIKYIRLQVRLYNGVGDIVSSSIGNQVSATLSYTGPLLNEDGNKRVDWGPIWYNSTGQCLKVISVQVTFMNGKASSFSGTSLKRALNPSISNECRATKP